MPEKVHILESVKLGEYFYLSCHKHLTAAMHGRGTKGVSLWLLGSPFRDPGLYGDLLIFYIIIPLPVPNWASAEAKFLIAHHIFDCTLYKLYLSLHRSAPPLATGSGSPQTVALLG